MAMKIQAILNSFGVLIIMHDDETGFQTVQKTYTRSTIVRLQEHGIMFTEECVDPNLSAACHGLYTIHNIAGVISVSVDLQPLVKASSTDCGEVLHVYMIEQKQKLYLSLFYTALLGLSFNHALEKWLEQLQTSSFHPKLSTKGGCLKTIICEVFTIHKNEDLYVAFQ